MFRFFVFFSCFLAAHLLLAQTQLASFDLQTNNIEAVQAFEVRDSLFFTYTAKVPGTSEYVKKGYWIDHLGRINEQPFNILPGMPSCGITRVSGNTFYYFVGVAKGVVSLQIFRQGIGDQQIIASPTSIAITGNKLLSATAQENLLTVISYQEETQEVIVVTVEGDNEKNRKIFKLPVSLKSFYKSSSGILLKAKLTDIEQATSKMKMYHEGDNIVITIDEVFIRNASKTHVFKLNLPTGLLDAFVVTAPDDDRFNSFYYQDRLYRIIMSGKRFQFKVYDVKSAKEIHDTQITKMPDHKEREVFFRAGGTKKTGYDNLHTMFAAAPESMPAIVVEPIDNSTDVRVVIGTHFDDKGGGVIVFPEPTLLIASFLISRAVISLQESPGIARYYYMLGNAEKGFSFEAMHKDKDLSIRQVIDEYEYARTMAMTKGLERWELYLKYKAYIPFKNGAIGIYQEQRKREKKILLYKFGPK